MKKIFISILILISVQSFGQEIKKYAERLNTDLSIDSFYHKLFTDSVFAYSNDAFISFRLEFYEQRGLPFPPQFSNFVLGADGVYRNFTPRAESVDWTGVNNKPSTFTATATTVGANLLALPNPASTSLPGINSDGTTFTRTLAQVITDLGVNLKASLTGSEVITNKTLGAFNVGLDAGANDSYVITLSPAPAAYTTGMIVIFRANTANTTGCTINVNGLGVTTIVKRVSTTPATGDILSQMWCMLIYNGGTFVLLNPVVN